MIRIYHTLWVAILVANASCGSSDKPAANVSGQAILVNGADIINVIDGSIQENKAILIDSGKIHSIGDYPTLRPLVGPGDVIDAKGKFVIPGLWDMHIHIEGEELVEDNLALFPVFIAYGITTVRDMASDLGEQVLKWREEIDRGKILAPRIFTAGRKLEGINSIWKGDLEIGNEQELEQMLNKLEAYDVDLVKITENMLEGPLFLKSVREARKRGFLVSGHVPHDVTISELAEAGISSIEHASYLLRLGADESHVTALVKKGLMTKSEADDYYLSNFNQDTALSAYKKLGKKQVALTPTLIGGRQLAYLDEDKHAQDSFLEYLTERFTANYQWRLDRMADETIEQKQQRRERYELIAKQLPFIQEAGISILAGSDAAALNTFVYPALALHDELVLFQDTGLTPLQILQSATINGARFMGVLHSTSTIEVGKEADIVLLNSNPLLDIRSTRDIHAVINNGRYFNRAQLDLILEEAKEKKVELDQRRSIKGSGLQTYIKTDRSEGNKSLLADVYQYPGKR